MGLDKREREQPARATGQTSPVDGTEIQRWAVKNALISSKHSYSKPFLYEMTNEPQNSKPLRVFLNW